MKRIVLSLGLCSACIILGCSASNEENPGVEGLASENYNYVVATQNIGNTYKFTQEDILVEGCRRIREMGSNVVKVTLTDDAYDLAPFSHTYRYELLEYHPSFRKVMEMGFTYYLFWVYGKKKNTWQDGLTAQEAAAEYDEIFMLADYFYRKYASENKRFFIGHWEGDWHLTNTNSSLAEVDPVRIQGMIDWYKVRQKAVDDARQKYPAAKCRVYHYAEVNRVNDYLDKGYDRIVNRVLPYVDVDYVSYSSYESIKGKDVVSYPTLRTKLFRALDAIEAAMKSKPSIAGKRVFIGEYGYSRNEKYNEDTQDEWSRMVMRAGIEWGCPFVLSWQIYDNNGHGLIDDKNVKMKIYDTHARFLLNMKQYVDDFFRQNGRVPDRAEYASRAIEELR